MRQETNKQKNFVTPGDPLYVIEEYLPGPGSYSDEKGWVRAAQIGRLIIDQSQRIVYVKQVLNKPFVPRSGDIVLGIVTGVSDDIAFLDIFQIEGKISKSTSFDGIIHISQVSEQYIETMYEAMRPGDVVRAKVLNNNPPFQLTTKGPQFGLILGLCSKCGSILKRQQNNMLICPNCGRIEKRKVSIKYIYR